MSIEVHRAPVLAAALVILGAGAGAPVAVFAQDTIPVQETGQGETAAPSGDPELEARVEEIARELRCPTCRALSVEDSPSGMAQEMRGLIREQLESGKTREEVLAYFVDRYGEWILLKPKAKGFNWTVWLLPIALLAGGLLFVFVTARRWVQQGQARAAALSEPDQDKN